MMGLMLRSWKNILIYFFEKDTAIEYYIEAAMMIIAQYFTPATHISMMTVPLFLCSTFTSHKLELVQQLRDLNGCGHG